MNQAFAPRRIERTVAGVRVIARSLTAGEAIAHRKLIEKGDRAEAIANIIAKCCLSDAGAPLFASAAEVLDADSDVVGELAKVALEANGQGGGGDASENPSP